MLKKTNFNGMLLSLKSRRLDLAKKPKDNLPNDYLPKDSQSLESYIDCTDAKLSGKKRYLDS